MEQATSLLDRLKPALETLRREGARAFWFTLAVLFLVESWLWDNVKEWLRALERRLGLERFEAWLTTVVADFSPQRTLALFAVPIIAILPLKLVALSVFAHGHFLTGVALILGAKTLALGVEAFLFDICREKLLQMDWFARFYSIVLDIRAWASLLVRPYKARLSAILTKFRATARSLLGAKGGEFARRVARLRAFTRPRRST